MRLFAAVLPPAGALAELGEAADRLRALPGAGELRWTSRPGWHLTLAFMGEVAEETVPALCERLDRAARRTAPLGLRLTGGGHFGRRALWAGVDGDLDALRLLAGRCEAAARRAGVPMEDHRRYRPHLTLARARRDTVDLSPYLALLDAFEGTPWTAGELSLVRSNLPAGGPAAARPRYETVACRPLAGPG
ncbi:RNA 2',3'-cyclic phosphodiesterase [Streptomyces termitum]|uniref:RNA 2',3'-cyclic phosphodiesterase n=1 Tax=Streptomyces termitum TaxID=67368 RepID=UPI0033B935AD